MTDIIELLYETQCNSESDESETTTDLDKLYEKESDLFDQIHAALDLKTLDELNYTQAKIKHILELNCFREGFRLGASLILELL